MSLDEGEGNRETQRREDARMTIMRRRGEEEECATERKVVLFLHHHSPRRRHHVCPPICRLHCTMKRHPQQQEYRPNANPLHDEVHPCMPAGEGSRRTREMANATRCMATTPYLGMGGEVDDGTALNQIGEEGLGTEVEPGSRSPPIAMNTKAARARADQGCCL
ncbi:hypothetical protein BDZ97DRAFT_1794888 [Flammula alnicola]|nr:hypothetical protein BDZ97DRAFT_1794888 [Flammula alnicola]